MLGFLEYVVRKLVDYPGEVRIECQETGQIIEFRLSLHPEDVGKVIGRHGRTISAIRALVNSTATKHGKRALVEINDDKSGGQSAQAPVSAEGNVENTGADSAGN